MNKYYVATGVIVVAVVAAFIYYSQLKEPENTNTCDQWTTDEFCNPISLDTSTWETFINPVYGYEISYPTESNLRTVNDYGDNVDHIYFGIPGRFTLGGVDASIYDNFSSDLRLYAEQVRNLQISDSSPNMKDKQIGLLEESEVSGRRSYSFTVTKGFDSPKVGYVIPDGTIYLYTITDNPNGHKIIIYHFKDNPIAEAMIKTITFQ